MTTAQTAERGGAAARAEDDPRRRQLLEASLGVFLRFGFRKTSMDEVARAAGVSRQGLYLHFATKEALFRATVERLLSTALEGAERHLADDGAAPAARLVGAFDEWVGRYVGMFGPGAADLAEASQTLAGPLIERHDKLFLDAVARHLRASGLLAAYKPAGLTARQLAETLYATARGLKHACSSRADFGERFELAVRALCLPLRRGP